MLLWDKEAILTIGAASQDMGMSVIDAPEFNCILALDTRMLFSCGNFPELGVRCVLPEHIRGTLRVL